MPRTTGAFANGNPLNFASPRDAHAAGIAMIPQELDLVAGLDIAGNLFLGNEVTRWGVVPRNVTVPTQRIDQNNAKSLFGKEQF